MRRLQGRVALITGAARGIGAALARAFVREGARVVLGDLDESAAGQAPRAMDPADQVAAVAVLLANDEASGFNGAHWHIARLAAAA